MEEALSFVANFNGLPTIPSFKSPSIFDSNAAPTTTTLVSAQLEIRVCVNRTCRKQGSMETLETLSGIAPPSIAVKSCGCLGRCGAGPNLVALPAGVMVGHCGTAAQAAALMMELCGGAANGEGASDSASISLAALALRKRAEFELQMGNFSDAEGLLSEAINLKPYGGLHLIYIERSRTKLAMGNYFGALEDAKDASTLAPQYPEAYICQGDAFLAMNQFDAAEKAYSTSLQLDPSIRRSKSFKDPCPKTPKASLQTL